MEQWRKFVDNGIWKREVGVGINGKLAGKNEYFNK
jgi:hypothetical protein